MRAALFPYNARMNAFGIGLKFGTVIMGADSLPSAFMFIGYPVKLDQAETQVTDEDVNPAIVK